MQSTHLVFTLFLAGFLAPLFFACTAASPQEGLVDGHLRPCPSTPNCVNSEAPSGEARIEPLVFKGSPEQAWRDLERAIGETGGEIVADEEGYRQAVYTSLFFRFKDDVEFRLAPEESVIHLRSASRVGYSDLGANRRRVERIRKRFEALSQIRSD